MGEKQISVGIKDKTISLTGSGSENLKGENSTMLNPLLLSFVISIVISLLISMPLNSIFSYGIKGIHFMSMTWAAPLVAIVLSIIVLLIGFGCGSYKIMKLSPKQVQVRNN